MNYGKHLKEKKIPFQSMILVMRPIDFKWYQTFFFSITYSKIYL